MHRQCDLKRQVNGLLDLPQMGIFKGHLSLLLRVQLSFSSSHSWSCLSCCISGFPRGSQFINTVSSFSTDSTRILQLRTATQQTPCSNTAFLPHPLLLTCYSPSALSLTSLSESFPPFFISGAVSLPSSSFSFPDLLTVFYRMQEIFVPKMHNFFSLTCPCLFF